MIRDDSLDDVEVSMTAALLTTTSSTMNGSVADDLLQDLPPLLVQPRVRAERVVLEAAALDGIAGRDRLPPRDHLHRHDGRRPAEVDQVDVPAQRDRELLLEGEARYRVEAPRPASTARSTSLSARSSPRAVEPNRYTATKSGTASRMTSIARASSIASRD